MADFNEVLKIDPYNFFAFYNRAVAYDLTGNKEAAITDLKRAVAINPNDILAQEKLAEVMGKIGSLPKAAGN